MKKKTKKPKKSLVSLARTHYVTATFSFFLSLFSTENYFKILGQNVEEKNCDFFFRIFCIDLRGSGRRLRRDRQGATGAWNLTLADCVYFLTIQAFHVLKHRHCRSEIIYVLIKKFNIFILISYAFF